MKKEGGYIMKQGFSLLEMLVVMLIVAVVAAATAPMINKKVTGELSGDSPWVWTGTTNSIAFNLKGADRTTAVIGALQSPKKTRLYVEGGSIPQIILGRSGSNSTLDFQYDNNSYLSIKGASSVAIGSTDTSAGSCAVAVGTGAKAQNATNVAIGHYATANSGEAAIAIGPGTNATTEAVALGNGAIATKYNSIAIGKSATSAHNNSVAIGVGASTTAANQVMLGTLLDTVKVQGTLYPDKVNFEDLADTTIGKSTAKISIPGKLAVNKIENISAKNIISRAENSNIVVVGDANSSLKLSGNKIVNSDGGNLIKRDGNTIILGGANTTVKIEGNFIAQKDVQLSEVNYNVKIGAKQKNGNNPVFTTIYRDWDDSLLNDRHCLYVISDRRLKNVGEEFKGGLEEIKKLQVFNYTFKKDKAKAPRVGVIAQDLEKIFPNAVIKGDDGFLRIRMEDIWYSAVNAIKQLDSKITVLVDDLKTATTDIFDLKSKVATQEKAIAELIEQNKAQDKIIKDLEKRLAKLEKKSK